MSIFVLSLVLLASRFEPLQDPVAGGEQVARPEQSLSLIPADGFQAGVQVSVSSGAKAGGEPMAIARWDCVPFQKVEEVLDVGVVAFHRNGIDRVEFSAEGGPWVAIRAMTRNPQTLVHEYWVPLRRQHFRTGPIEVRAVAYPTNGIPRALEPLHLYIGSTPASAIRWASPDGSDAQGDGTEALPYRTMWKAATAIQEARGKADGGIVYLKPGTYDFARTGNERVETNSSWLTFQPAPGVRKHQVQLVSSTFPGIDTKRVRLVDLWVRALLHGDAGGDRHLWLDGCHLQGTGQQSSVHSVGWYWGFDSVFVTRCRVTDNQFGPRGATLVRNCFVRRIGEDCLDGVSLVLNTSVSNVNRGANSDWHPDVLTFSDSKAVDNCIIYGLKVTGAQAQGLYGVHGAGSVDNVALVNVLMELSGSYWVSQWEIPTDHFLMWNCSFVGHRFNWRTPESSLRNISVRGTYFEKMGIDTNPIPPSPGGDALDDSWFADCHFSGPDTLILGANATTGDPRFVSVAKGDYHPAPDSILFRRMAPLVPADLEGNPRQGLSSVGTFR